VSLLTFFRRLTRIETTFSNIMIHVLFDGWSLFPGKWF
jgi:hypothetical protein